MINVHGENTSSPTAPDVPAVGTCLEDMNGYDSDRRSIVDCTELHLYDVVGSAEWPGMADAIEEAGSAERVFGLIIAHRAGPLVNAYDAWADEQNPPTIPRPTRTRKP